MPSMPTPNSQSMPQPDNAGPPMQQGMGGQKGNPNQTPPGKMGGDIMISAAEAIALTALETDDPKVALKRASAESGMKANQVRKLQARARRARSNGFTLKGGNIILKPTNHELDAPQGNGLAPDTGEDDDESTSTPPKKGAAAKDGPAPRTHVATVATRKAREAEFEAAIERVKREADRSTRDLQYGKR